MSDSARQLKSLEPNNSELEECSAEIEKYRTSQIVCHVDGEQALCENTLKERDILIFN